MTYISKMLFNQYQSLYIAPAVEEYWKVMKEEEWKERDGKDVILSSDGRNDSPGHCAQYLTYSFADMESKTILNLNIVDVREVEGRKSTNMERLGFERGLDGLLTSSMNIQELVTDGHLGISALISMLYFKYMFFDVFRNSFWNVFRVELFSHYFAANVSTCLHTNCTK